MRIVHVLKHIGITLAAIALLVVIPVFTHLPVLNTGGGADAKSSASVALPDSPSGNYYLLVKDSFTKDDNFEDWKTFFLADDDDELPVLFDNIHCMVADGDSGAQQLAERYQAFLSPDQLEITAENATLFISKVESGNIEMAIISADMADALGFSPDQTIKGFQLLKVTQEE